MLPNFRAHHIRRAFLCPFRRSSPLLSLQLRTSASPFSGRTYIRVLQAFHILQPQSLYPPSPSRFPQFLLALLSVGISASSFLQTSPSTWPPALRMSSNILLVCPLRFLTFQRYRILTSHQQIWSGNIYPGLA